MTDNRYNGWTNYATWCVNLWLTNDQDMTEWAEEIAQQGIDSDQIDDRSDMIRMIADALESMVDEMLDATDIPTAGLLIDLLRASIGDVDWCEIAESMAGDIVLYSAGWNMPGFMPDASPIVTIDADTARSHIADAMREDAQTCEVDDNGETCNHLVNRADDLDTSKAEGNQAEYGCTVAGRHYFITTL